LQCFLQLFKVDVFEQRCQEFQMRIDALFFSEHTGKDVLNLLVDCRDVLFALLIAEKSL